MQDYVQLCQICEPCVLMLQIVVNCCP
uniref:Uncharacterized protein n=1 Tax=Arundo donax TaxID=35708 RepID=A0A0A9C9J3_ARUDO